jgi:hypothetical protein
LSDASSQKKSVVDNPADDADDDVVELSLSTLAQPISSS